MGAYITRRILTSIPTLLVIVTIAFFMIRIAPGGPFDQERALPPQIEKNVLKAYNLDQPLVLQYWDYLVGVLQGDFGPSFKYRDFTVAELLWTGFPASLKVGGFARSCWPWSSASRSARSRHSGRTPGSTMR